MKYSWPTYLLIAALYLATTLVLYLAFFYQGPGGKYAEPLHLVVFIFIVLVLARNFIYLLLNPWYSMLRPALPRKHIYTGDSSYAPSVSVIIPAWNEEVGIVRTIESVMRSTYRNLEVVVVNDGSTDNTEEVIQHYLARRRDEGGSGKQGPRVHYLYQRNAGKGAALNRGIAAASGDIILTLDADSLVEPHTIAAFVRVFEDPTVDAAMGRIKVGNQSGLLGFAQHLEYLLTFYFKRSESVLDSLYVVGGAAAAYRRRVFSQVGYFDTQTITEDIDLSLRLHAEGKKIAYAYDALVWTEGASTLFSLIKQRLRWRRGRYDALVRYRHLFFNRSSGASPLLTYFVLPFSLLLELLLFLEPFFLAFIVVHSVLTGNYLSFGVLVIIVSFMVFLASLSDKNAKDKLFGALVAPVAWWMYYLIVFVEYFAQLKALYTFFLGKRIIWQQWERRGIGHISASLTANSPQVRSGFSYIFSGMQTRLSGFFSRLGNRVIALLVCLFFGGLAFLFYINMFIGGFGTSPIVVAVLFALASDGVLLFLHLFRTSAQKLRKSQFDPSKVTVVIACYNGAKIIPETIRQAMVHVPPEQILVVSDASTDDTVAVAKSFGVRVYENNRNLNKALSISAVAEHIKTEYALILDDDTHIAKTKIDTGLLDEGYAALAFNVMPEPGPGLLNKLQTFEYRKSMFLGKELRADVGAIGNVSGAIGLFCTEDLRRQATLHSGQFGGEDQQRTMLVHLENTGKGIAYTSSRVYTEAPATLRALFRQRAYKWNAAAHEIFWLCLLVIWNPRTHFLLKFERAYLMFVLITDPLRIVLTPLLFFHPEFLLYLYIVYFYFTVLGYLKTGARDPWYILPINPLYTFFNNIARFVAHFYWLKMKWDYVIKKKLHRLVPDRPLLVEYGGVLTVLLLCWSLTGYYMKLYGGAAYVQTFQGASATVWQYVHQIYIAVPPYVERGMTGVMGII